MPYATNKGADQPAHPLASVAEQASLSLTWSQTAKTGFLLMGSITVVGFYHTEMHTDKI